MKKNKSKIIIQKGIEFFYRVKNVVKNGAICAKNTGILNPRETLTLIYNAQTL